MQSPELQWGEDFTCVLCKKDIKGEWGNNPWPLAEKGQCCNVCNTKVIAQRLEDHMKNKNSGSGIVSCFSED